MSSPVAVYRRAVDVRYRLISGEGVVLRQRAGEVLGLNEIGARIIDLCDGRRTVLEIVDLLESEFEAERARLERDASAFLDELVAIGVLELETAGLTQGA